MPFHALQTDGGSACPTPRSQPHRPTVAPALGLGRSALAAHKDALQSLWVLREGPPGRRPERTGRGTGLWTGQGEGWEEGRAWQGASCLQARPQPRPQGASGAAGLGVRAAHRPGVSNGWCSSPAEASTVTAEAGEAATCPRRRGLCAAAEASQGHPDLRVLDLAAQG